MTMQLGNCSALKSLQELPIRFALQCGVLCWLVPLVFHFSACTHMHGGMYIRMVHTVSTWYTCSHSTLQVLPVVFAVSATLTSSALEFSVKEMDFGCVGIHESVLSSIGITNTSLLVQEIGFVNVPDVRVVCAGEHRQCGAELGVNGLRVGRSAGVTVVM